MLAVRAVLIGLLIAIVGEMVLGVIFLVNLYLLPDIPWGVVPAAGFVVLLWRYLAGIGRPPEEAEERRRLLRARALPARGWPWALAAIVAALAALRGLARLTAPAALLPEPLLARLGEHDLTLWAIFVVNYLLFAPLIEEAAFRGYMQVPLEAGYGPAVAVPVVAVVFTLLHAYRGMAWIYLGIALFLGALAWRAGTLWPGVVAHGTVNLWALFPGRELPVESWLAASGPGRAPALVAASALACVGALYGLGRARAPARESTP